MKSKQNLGFTLIELLITTTIITLLFSLGISQYNKFNRRQILVKAKEQLLSDLRLAQSKSLAAEKPADCPDVLSGIELKFAPDNKGYKIVAVCGEEIDIKEVNLPPEVVKQTGPSEVFFKVLSQGVSSNITITLSGFGETRDISISTAGEIK